MKVWLLLMVLVAGAHTLFGQVLPLPPETDTTTSVYKGLETRKWYAVGTSATSYGTYSEYKVGGKIVSKEVYDKYHSTWENMRDCRPCILLAYDYDDNLISKSVQYTDCPVGYLIDYFPGGGVKLVGHYKENPTGNWTNWKCRKDGTWTYFDEQGKKLYSEYWKDGDFIRQVPEQDKLEVWRVEFTLKGQDIESDTLTPEEIKAVKVTPRFKNKLEDVSGITIRIQVGAVGYKQMEQSVHISKFNSIDIIKMLRDSGMPTGQIASVYIIVFLNGRQIDGEYFKVKEE